MRATCYVCGMSADAEAEVATIALSLHSIAEALEDPLSLERALAELTELTARCDLFTLRFGTQPHEVAGWAAVQQHAEALLAHPALHRKGDIYFNEDSARVGYVELLQLSGRYDEALARLENVEAGGGCGNWMATVYTAVHQRRSSLHAMAGRLAEALKEQRTAVSWSSFSLYEMAAEVMYVRLGALLVANGEPGEAVAAYQRVVDLYPRTAAWPLARQALVEMNALVEPTATRLLERYADQTDNWVLRSLGIVALGGHRFPESYDLLMARLRAPEPRRQSFEREAWFFDRARLISALGQLGDPRAVPALRQFGARESIWRGHVTSAIALIEVT